eukprot:2454296-Pyramimonas_sp.AAC.1
MFVGSRPPPSPPSNLCPPVSAILKLQGLAIRCKSWSVCLSARAEVRTRRARSASRSAWRVPARGAGRG